MTTALLITLSLFLLLELVSTPTAAQISRMSREVVDGGDGYASELDDCSRHLVQAIDLITDTAKEPRQ
jgi:hypothetical protein